jgi:DNA repair photolyase
MSVIKEIQAKTLVTTVRGADPVFALDYNFNLYRGCQHRCIYCDSRSECYQIEDFDGEILVKANALELLERELSRKRRKGVIGTGSMNDPYMPLEAKLDLTGQALEVIARHGFGVSIITKSALVVRDTARLQAIARHAPARVCFTITTTDDVLARKIEPGASLVSARLKALRTLADAGLAVGVTLMPVLPFIEDTPENITAVVEQAAAHGAQFILPWFGMSMRDRQREYFYARLDELFPGVREQYQSRFGDRYEAPARNAAGLLKLFDGLCARLGLATKMPPYRSGESQQLSLFWGE